MAPERRGEMVSLVGVAFHCGRDPGHFNDRCCGGDPELLTVQDHVPVNISRICSRATETGPL